MAADRGSSMDEDTRTRVEQAVAELEACSFKLHDPTLSQAVKVKSASNIDGVISSLKRAVESLSRIRDGAARDAAFTKEVNAAVNHLRDVLEALQTVSFDAPEVDPVTRRIAKIVALLYPLLKAAESRTSDHPSPKHRRPSAFAIERRSGPRIPVEAEVGFQSDTNFFMGFSEDISLGGLFVATFDTKPLGSALNVNLSLPSGYLISAEGVVRWIRAYHEASPDISPGMGIQFETLSSRDREAIERFIRQRPALFYDDE